MPRAVAYKTHTGLLIALEQEDEEHVVTITGDRVKEIARTPVHWAAGKRFVAEVRTYRERAKAEA